jgi:hypothetical protein
MKVRSPRIRTHTHDSVPPSTREPRRSAGFSLLEVSLAIVTLTVTLVGVTGSIVAGDELQHVNRESALAEDAARRTVETLRGLPFETVFARYNASSADDPGGMASPGENFDVPGLDADPDDADGFVGLVEFPVVPLAPDELREDLAGFGFGLPADLSGDGNIDANDHAGDYVLLPVRVTVAWSGKSGVRNLAVETILCAR